MRTQSQTTYSWTVIEKRDEAPDVVSLILKATAVRPDFVAGQYLTIMLPDHEPTEGKCYSISSPEHEECIAITIKSIGDFSAALATLALGTSLTTTAPYGFFHPEEDEERPLVFVAGGIGITPCMSIIETLLARGFSEQLSLFYSNQKETSIIFNERLTALSHQSPNFALHHFITREIPTDPRLLQGRMTGEHILTLLPKNEDADFFICGSIDFTKNLWLSLKNAGIPSTQLYTEGFF